MDGTAQSNSKPEAATPKRRKWSAEERQRIVQASLKAGATVDAVARLYGVHASQIYDWRKEHRQRMQAGKRSVLLPVRVAEGAPRLNLAALRQAHCSGVRFVTWLPDDRIRGSIAAE